jgi:hypothetical protein
MNWSRRTAFVYLKRLEDAGIATSGGLSSYHGTKRRELHSERLLSVPLESCTPTPRESCTRSKSLDSKKLQRCRRSQNHPTDDAAAAVPRVSSQPKTNGNTQTKSNPPVEERHNSQGSTAAKTLPLGAVIRCFPGESPPYLAYLVGVIAERAAKSHNTVRKPEAYTIAAVLNELEQQAAQFEPYQNAADLQERAPEMRANVARLHAMVEEAARRGVPAREVLAERLAP